MRGVVSVQTPKLGRTRPAQSGEPGSVALVCQHNGGARGCAERHANNVCGALRNSSGKLSLRGKSTTEMVGAWANPRAGWCNEQAGQCLPTPLEAGADLDSDAPESALTHLEPVAEQISNKASAAGDGLACTKPDATPLTRIAKQAIHAMKRLMTRRELMEIDCSPSPFGCTSLCQASTATGSRSTTSDSIPVIKSRPHVCTLDTSMPAMASLQSAACTVCQSRPK